MEKRATRGELLRVHLLCLSASLNWCAKRSARGVSFFSLQMLVLLGIANMSFVVLRGDISSHN